MGALAKQSFSLPFTQGVDTKTDEKMLALGKLKSCIDAIFSRSGALMSRNGYAQLGGSLGTIQGAGGFDGELDLFCSGTGLFAYSQAANAFVSKGYLRAPTLTSKGVAADPTRSYRHADSASAGQVVVYAWVDPASQALYAAAYDTIDGTQVIAPTNIANTVYACRVVAEGNFIYVFYSSNTSVLQVALNVTAPTGGFAAPGTVVATDLVNHQWSVAFCGGAVNSMVIAWRSIAAANAPKVAKCPGAILGTPTAFGVAFNDFKGAFNLGFDARASRVICMNQTAAGTIGVYVLSSALALVGSFTITNANTIVQSATAIGNQNATITVWFTVRDTTTLKRTTYSVLTNASGSNLGSGIFLLGFELASEAFNEGTSTRVHLWVRNLSSFQPTYFCVDELGNCIAKALYARASSPPVASGGSVVDIQQLPRPWAFVAGTNHFGFAAASIGAFESDPSGQTTANTAVSVVSLDFTNERYRPVQVGRNLIINGAVLSMYDGSSVSELNFHLLPELPVAHFVLAWTASHVVAIGDWTKPNPGNGFVYQALTGGTTSGSAPSWNTTVGSLTTDGGIFWKNMGATAASLSDGTRFYQVVYEYTDAGNQVHRSGPSVQVLSTVVTGGTNDATLAIEIPTLKLTAHRNVRCTVYRTQNAGTVLQRVGYVANNPAADVVYFIDGVSDTTIASAPSGYFVGELGHVPPPAGQALLLRNDRLYVGAGETAGVVAASQFVNSGEGVSFGFGTELDLDKTGGDVVALAALDEKLVILKSAGFTVVVGDGPSNNGSQNDWSTPQNVPSDCGCLTADSVTVTPDGVWFQSTKGYRLLDRAMQLEYVGADMEGLSSETCLGAVVMPTADQVRFLTASRMLIFDTFAKQWSSTSIGGVATTTWLGQHILCRTTTVGAEQAGLFSDFGAMFNPTLITGWINLAGEIAGYARLYKMGLLIEDPEFNDDAFGGTITIAVQFRDDASPSNLVFGNFLSVGATQIEFNPNSETSDAVQVTITVTRADPSQDIYLNALTFLVGQKSRFVKLPGGNRVG